MHIHACSTTHYTCHVTRLSPAHLEFHGQLLVFLQRCEVGLNDGGDDVNATGLVGGNAALRRGGGGRGGGERGRGGGGGERDGSSLYSYDKKRLLSHQNDNSSFTHIRVSYSH